MDSRRGRGSESDAVGDFATPDVWTQNHLPTPGGASSIGLGLNDHGLDVSGVRGRDTVSRGLETPGYRNSKRVTSSYEGGSGTVSAPLSPHRLYAQLELGKGPQPSQPNWSAYDPRQYASPGMPVDRVAGPSSYRNVSGPTTASRSGSMAPVNGQHLDTETPSSLPSFAPFSPDTRTSTLQPLKGEPADYISPSTLLSPEQIKATLPKNSVEGLAASFDKLGVKPPGAGAENPKEKREEESKS